MKKTGLITLSILMFVFLVPVFTSAAEPEDPYYKQWASFKTGSNVTLVGRAEDTKGIEAFTQTITLKEIGNDYLMIEISRKMETSGPIVKNKKVDRFISRTDKIEFRGQEEIDVAGKKFKCQKYTLTITDDSGKEMMRFDYWFHPDIPGAARIVAQSSSGTSTATQTAVSWEKK
jgi:hypothetical protein